MQESTSPKIRFQFSVRVALLIMTLAAVGCWWIWTPEWTRQVTPGMSEKVVSQILGAPWDVRTNGKTTSWSYPRYSSAGYESGELLIRFGSQNKKVRGGPQK